MKNRLFAYFDLNPSKAYPIIYSPVYDDNFYEKIDSMSILLDFVEEEDRLNFERPYHFVKIVNDIPTGETGFKWKEKYFDNGEVKTRENNYIIMLLDNWVETCQVAGEGKIYKYEINLMNCVKLLEKVQCPDLTITHSLVNGHESIWFYIDQYMQIYCPKVKMSTDGENWSYEYLLDWSELNNAPFNNTECADMQMNAPTLRELLTSLMLQVGVIPRLYYRRLFFMDYREEPSELIINDDDGITIPSNISGSSDSYANTLVQSPSQILDDKNEVICDTVGFRDSDNAIISQTNNLQLETRFPIYKINEVRLRGTVNTEGRIVATNEANTVLDSQYPILIGRLNDQVDPSLTLSNNWDCPPQFIKTSEVYGEYHLWDMYLNFLYHPVNNVAQTCRLENIKAHFYNSGANGYEEVATIEIPGSWILHPTISENTHYGAEMEYYDDEPHVSELVEGEGINIPGSCTFRLKYSLAIDKTDTSDFTQIAQFVWFENDIKLGTTVSIHQATPMFRIIFYSYAPLTRYYAWNNITINSDNRAPGYYYYSSGYGSPNLIPDNPINIPANIGIYVDITPLIVENNKRRLLEVNYVEMKNNVVDILTSSIQDLAKYVYGTMGYSIGDNKITGFSSTYSRAQWWWSYTTSYIDLILGFIQDRKSSLVEFDYDRFVERYRKQFDTYRQQMGNLYVEKSSFSVYDNTNWSTDIYKTKFLFDIYYQPLNSFKLKMSKEGKDIPLSIEQLNNTADGLSDYSRVSKNAQDMVNKIGNAVLTMPQTTTDVTKIKELNSIYNGKYVLFSRKISLSEEYISVTYCLSEKYVIKNYFTSIITKYRAYEYVDYNNSVVRKENKKIYCLISDKHYIDGDDNLIVLQNFYSLQDIANILNVEITDINQYITYESDLADPKYLTYFVSYGIKFFVSALSARGSNSTSTWNFNLAEQDIGFLTNSYNDYLYTYDAWFTGTNPTNSENVIASYGCILDGGGYSIGYSDALNIVMTSTLDTLSLRRQTLYDFVADNVSFQNYRVIDQQYTLLSKMNGKVLEHQGNYYRVRLVNNAVQTGNVDTAFNITKYVDIYTLFYISQQVAQQRMEQTSAGSTWVDLNVEGKVVSLYYQYQDFYIYLEELAEDEIGEIIQQNLSENLLFLTGITMQNQNFRFKYVIEKSVNDKGFAEEVRGESSLLTNKNGFAVYYQDYDNVSAGPYLFDLAPSPAGSGTPYAGGYVQKWQMWNQESFNKRHEVRFSYDLLLNLPDGTDTIDDYIKTLPIINRGWNYNEFTLLQLVDNNKILDYNYTFYKDNAEIINQTVQFEYYSDDGDVIWSENFINNNRMVNRFNKDNNGKIGLFLLSGKFELSENPVHRDNYVIENINAANSHVFIDYDVVLRKPFISIDWSYYGSSIFDQIVISYYVSGQNGGYDCYDLMAFRKNGRKSDGTRYYLSLNDTKTTDVWYFKNDNDLFETWPCLNGLQRKISGISAPVLSSTLSNDNMELSIRNTNDFEVTFKMSDSRGVYSIEYTVPANSSIALSTDPNSENYDEDFEEAMVDPVYDYFHGLLDYNILGFFTSESSPIDSDNAIVLEGDTTVKKPVITNRYETGAPNYDYEIQFYNPNIYPVTLVVFGSQEYERYVVPAQSTNTITKQLADEHLSDAYEEYANGTLADTVYMYFINNYSGEDSDNTILWEANV